jgi:hypothetical protein
MVEEAPVASCPEENRMATEVGEYLVGAHLKLVKEWDFRGCGRLDFERGKV